MSNLDAQVWSAFAKASSLQGEQRTAFLEQLAQQTPEVAQALSDLLVKHESADDDPFGSKAPLHLLKPPNPNPSLETQDHTPPSQGDLSTVDPGQRESSVASSSHPPLANSNRISIPGYEILEELGQGGMGVVYKARHIKLDRIVAVKMILTSKRELTDSLTRFLDEARALAKFSHPNIVQVYDVNDEPAPSFMALEFVTGGSLQDKIKKEGKLAANEATKLIIQIARGIQAAHDQGIIHRDLKPGNVLITEDGVVKVTDFGLAKRVEGDAELTQSGAILGTPSYMAPEQAAGEPDKVGKHSDVYALGGVLYACLTGRPPFKGGNSLDIVLQVLNGVFETPREIDPDIPEELENICLRCLSMVPKDRYDSPAAMAEDLERYLEGQELDKTTVSIVQKRAARSRSQHFLTTLNRPQQRLVLAGVASVALLLLLPLLGWWGGWFSPKPSEIDPRPVKKDPNRPGIMQPDQPANRTLQVKVGMRLWMRERLDDPPIALEERAGKPIRVKAGDRASFKVQVSQPAYIYAVLIYANGEADPNYPWVPGQWDQRRSEKPQAVLYLPENPNMGAPFGDGQSGIEGIFVMARKKPLSEKENAEVKKLFAKMPPQKNLGPLSNVVIIEPLAATFLNPEDPPKRGKFNQKKAIPLNDPVERMKRLVQLDLKPLAEARVGLCWPFEGTLANEQE